MISAMPVQCFCQLNYEATQMWPRLFCSRERNDEWKKHFFQNAFICSEDAFRLDCPVYQQVGLHLHTFGILQQLQI